MPAPPMAANILPLFSFGIISVNMDWNAGLMNVFGIVAATRRISTCMGSVAYRNK